MAVKRLTEAYIERIKLPETGRLEISDAVVPNLGLRVSKTGRGRTYLL